MPMKFKNILQAIFNLIFKRNISISKGRQNICKKCENILNVDNVKFCDICGCCIKLKTTVVSETCPAGKW